MDFVEYLRQKDWVSEDEKVEPLLEEEVQLFGEDQQLEDAFGNPMAKWTASENYNSVAIFEQLQEDDDVRVSDICLGAPIIVLMDNRDGDWD